jgi:hypothetical protein
MLTLFGVASVSLMLIAYALEERSPIFVLLFAGACGASSVYGFLVGAWPFGIVEAVWTAVAVRRWQLRAGDSGHGTTRPIACDMSALSPAERHRYDALRRLMLDSVEEVTGSATEFRVRLGRAVSPSEVAEWMDLEHRCCPFLTLRLALRDDGTTWIDLGGSAAIKAFLADEFKEFVPI